MTQEGKILERANPTNSGFYLMPIYQKRNLNLIVRSNNSNLNFEPSSYSLDIKSLTNEQIEDVFSKNSYNFKLAKVLSKGRIWIKSQTGNILSKDDITVSAYVNGKLVETSEIDDKGFYEFAKIDIGKYYLEAKHPSYKFEVSKINCELSITKGQKCDNEITIYGKTLFGKLTNTESAMGQIKIYLETLKGDEMPSMYCESQQKNKCVILSNENGEFSFEHVPYGEYKLTFAHSYKSNNGVIFTPSSKTVVHSEVQTIHTVELSGILPIVNGQVLNTLSNGIKDVNLFIDGQQKAITNQNGKFSIKDIKMGEFLIEGHHKNYFIKPMKFRVTSTSHSDSAIGKIVANYVSLCGQIDFSADPKEDTKNYKVKIHLEDVDNNNKMASSADLKDNKFCFEVTDGQYIVKPIITTGDKI